MVVHGAGRRVALVAPDLVEKLVPGREIATGPFRNLFEDPDGPGIVALRLYQVDRLLELLRLAPPATRRMKIATCVAMGVEDLTCQQS